MNIKELKNKFRELIQLNPDGEFRYINEALTEEEAQEFEKKHGIVLPPDYRAFITHMFDGGVGPQQIMPIQWWDSVHNAVYLGSLGNTLSQPFLLTDTWRDDDENEEQIDYDAIINGTIRLAHIGCGNFLFLAVNGEEYGNIWIDDRASNGEIVPYIDQKTGNRMTFETWYFNWLDNQIKYYKTAGRTRTTYKSTSTNQEDKKTFWSVLKRIWDNL